MSVLESLWMVKTDHEESMNKDMELCWPALTADLSSH